MQVVIFCELGLKTPIHAPKIGGFWGKIGEGVVVMLTPQWTCSYFWSLLPLCHFWRKSIMKCDCVSAERQTDGHTQTETNWIY